jgi:putative nucleotidyltransferase with HDIG domain
VEAVDLMLAAHRPEGERAWMWGSLWDAFAWCAPSMHAYLDASMVAGRSRRALLKLATLLHDVAKPQTRTVDETGRIRFLGHAEEGAAVAGRALRRLRFSTREGQFVALLVREHLRPVQLAQKGEMPTRRALYRFYRDLGDATPAVLLLSLADAAASLGPRLTEREWSAQVAYMNSLLVRSQDEEGIVSRPRLLTGHDIMRELDCAGGPFIGRLLEALGEAQAAGEVTDTEAALAYVRELARREQRQGLERG